MKCPYCGANLADNAILCTRCNRFLDSAPENQTIMKSSSTVKKSSANPYRPAPPKRSASKKSTVLLISWILGVLYAIYGIIYWAGATSGTTDAASAIGAGIAAALVMPHMICAVLAAIFNVLGWALESRGFALTGAILYAVAIVLFPAYIMFVIIQMILSFVGFAAMKK